MEHEGRGVGAPQCAVERERRQWKGLGPALRRDNLKDVARGDIVSGLLDSGEIIGLREVRHRGRHVDFLAHVAPGGGQGAVKVAHGVHHPFGGLGIGGTRRQAGPGPGGRDDDHLALHPVENRDHRGPQEHGVGQADGVGVHVGQMFDQPDHVIPEIAEQPRCGGGQIGGQVDAAFLDQGPKRGQGIGAVFGKGVAVIAGLPVDAGLVPVTLPDQVGFHPDDRIAPAHLAARHAFQHEGIRAGTRQAQHQRDRSIQIGRQPGIDDLVLAPIIGGLEGLV